MILLLLIFFGSIYILFKSLSSIFGSNKNYNKINNANEYIRIHNKKLRDDIIYEEYLKWCEEKGECPLDKKYWYGISDKEKSLDKLINNK